VSVQLETTTTLTATAHLAAAQGRDWFDYLQFALIALGVFLTGLLIVYARRSRTDGALDGWHVQPAGGGGQVMMTVNVTTTGSTKLRRGTVVMRDPAGEDVPKTFGPIFPEVYGGPGSQMVSWAISDPGDTVTYEVEVVMRFKDRGKVRAKKSLTVRRPDAA
jgi:hypothetical protein